MAANFRKRLINLDTYKDKGCLKHKHDYNKKHLLIVTNINKRASGNYYNSQDKYYVLKCDKCNSFIPDSVEGNFYHHIFGDEIIDDTLPVITANTIEKIPHYNFSKLIDVIVKDKFIS